MTVEVHLANGLPAFTLVGLPDTEVREARERVRAALQNSRFDSPCGASPSTWRRPICRRIGRFDLPIALGILAATGQLPSRVLDRYEFAGGCRCRVAGTRNIGDGLCGDAGDRRVRHPKGR